MSQWWNFLYWVKVYVFKISSLEKRRVYWYIEIKCSEKRVRSNLIFFNLFNSSTMIKVFQLERPAENGKKSFFDGIMEVCVYPRKECA